MTATLDLSATPPLPGPVGDRGEESLYRPGFVVVPREWQRIKGKKRGKRTRTGWTLHRDDCFQVVRDGVKSPSAMPAPTEPYPDTVSCRYCRPDDPHRYVYETLPDGSTSAMCTACEFAAHERSRKHAQNRMHRQHAVARAKEAMADALARGPVERVIADRSDGRGWTLHTCDCMYAGRNELLLPVFSDEDIPEGTRGCSLCRPAGAPITARRPGRPKERQQAVVLSSLDPAIHRITRTNNPDGTCRLVCTCGIDTHDRPNHNSARQALRRFHETQANRARRMADGVEAGKPFNP